MIQTGTLPLATTREDVDKNETLIWSTDGFCWLRGKGGKYRTWQGRFSTLVEAIKSCKASGAKPTAWLHL